jgi:hypothetical protein
VADVERVFESSAVDDFVPLDRNITIRRFDVYAGDPLALPRRGSRVSSILGEEFVRGSSNLGVSRLEFPKLTGGTYHIIAAPGAQYLVFSAEWEKFDHPPRNIFFGVGREAFYVLPLAENGDDPLTISLDVGELRDISEFSFYLGGSVYTREESDRLVPLQVSSSDAPADGSVVLRPLERVATMGDGNLVLSPGPWTDDVYTIATAIAGEHAPLYAAQFVTLGGLPDRSLYSAVGIDGEMRILTVGSTWTYDWAFCAAELPAGSPAELESRVYTYRTHSARPRGAGAELTPVIVYTPGR